MSVTDDGITNASTDIFYPAFTFYHVKDLNNVESIFKPTLYCIIAFCGLVGNSLVLWILMCIKKMNSVTDIYLLNMAVSDLLFVFSLPFAVYQIKDQWVFGNAMCKILSVIYYTGFYSGIFFITVLSVDRYLAILRVVFSLKFRTMKLGLFLSFTIWTFSVLLSIPNVLIHKEETEKGFTFCAVSYPEDQNIHWTELFSLLQVNIFGFIIPLAVILFCYSHIIRALQNSRSVQKKYAVRLILVIVIVFFLFWTPYNVVIFLTILDTIGTFGASNFTNWLKDAKDVTQTISFVHCCLNPVVYSIAGENFRKHLYNMFFKLLKCMRLKRHWGSIENSGIDKKSSTGKDTKSLSFTDTIV
ncbi:C-C chemokine receptor type 8-like [Pseudophryne corroboree]|uniref:C-C chemokine receptor type 8-like n=1 Tax=Pseudophryne corroboree TaxID=495146 RepID=UPI0030815A55